MVVGFPRKPVGFECCLWTCLSGALAAKREVAEGECDLVAELHLHGDADAIAGLGERDVVFVRFAGIVRVHPKGGSKIEAATAAAFTGRALPSLASRSWEQPGPSTNPNRPRPPWRARFRPNAQ
jgi:hypothetical protein